MALRSAGLLRASIPGKETEEEIEQRLDREVESTNIPVDSPLGRLLKSRWTVTSVVDAHGSQIERALVVGRKRPREIQLVKKFVRNAMSGSRGRAEVKRHFDPQLWKFERCATVAKRSFRELDDETVRRIELMALSCLGTRIVQQVRVLAEDGETEASFGRKLGYSDTSELEAGV